MKHLFVHIGTHKTGTTAVQKACLLNKVKLSSEDIHYINHRKYSAENDLTDYNSRSKSVNALSKLLNKNLNVSENKIFISWEGFSGNLLDYYRDRSDTLSILKEAHSKKRAPHNYSYIEKAG